MCMSCMRGALGCVCVCIYHRHSALVSVCFAVVFSLLVCSLFAHTVLLAPFRLCTSPTMPLHAPPAAHHHPPTTTQPGGELLVYEQQQRGGACVSGGHLVAGQLCGPGCVKCIAWCCFHWHAALCHECDHGPCQEQQAGRGGAWVRSPHHCNALFDVL